MDFKLINLLHLEWQPVGLFYVDEKPDDVLTMKAGKKNCVADVLMAAARGKKIVIDDETCGCAGGATGVGFGDAFDRRHHCYRYLLSGGINDVPAGEEVKLPPHMIEGERFFESPEVVQMWKDSLPFGPFEQKSVVFAPANRWDAEEKPKLVVLFVNPDQLSALVSMGGYRTGSAFETIAPFGAACQQIVYALNQCGKENPKMVMGFFDISQRGRIPANVLTLTMPYEKFEQLEEDADRGCLSSHSWVELMKTRGITE